MKKMLSVLLALATLASAVVVTTGDANAQWRRHRGGAGAAAVIGGLAAGAIIGGAIANSRPAYAYPRAYYPVAGYEPYSGYYAAPAYGCPGGYWARRPLYDRFGNVVGYSRPRFFCPR